MKATGRSRTFSVTSIRHGWRRYIADTDRDNGLGLLFGCGIALAGMFFFALLMVLKTLATFVGGGGNLSYGLTTTPDYPAGVNKQGVWVGTRLLFPPPELTPTDGRLISWAGLMMTYALGIMLCLMTFVLIREALMDRPFSLAARRVIVWANIFFYLLGLGGTLMQYAGAEQIAKTVERESDIKDISIIGTGIGLGVLIGLAITLFALLAIYRTGGRLYHDTQGLV